MDIVNKEGDKIFALLHKHHKPKIGLDRSTFSVLIGSILSANARDIECNKVMRAICPEPSDTPRTFLDKWSPESLYPYIKSVGLGRKKAYYILNSSKMIVDRFKGLVPSTRDQLMTLPGVGRKIANIVLNECYKVSAIAVDTHVARLAQRIGWSGATNRYMIEKDLKRHLKPKWHRDVNRQLTWLGKNYCKAKVTLCVTCPISKHCFSAHKVNNKNNK